MRDAFLDSLHGDGAILPRIIAIGDIDEDEIAFAESAAGGIAADALALPSALGGLERRLLLTRLVLAWAQSPEVRGGSGTPLIAQTPAAACALADDLARLIDDMTTRNAPWERLDELVPGEFDEYWQLTLRFLQIARKNWPQVLDEIGSIDPAARRDALIKAEAARLSRKSDGPVIVAGSTGSIPATADLIATVARLPHGAVVLPGLDTDLDEHSWRLIAGNEKTGIAAAPGHPQFAMAALLSRIGIGRDAVALLAPARGRERLISEALRPAQDRRCGIRSTNRRRAVEFDNDRGRPSGGRGARRRGSAARGRGREQDSRFDYAGSPTGPPRRRRARPLGYRGGGYRR
jgi:ATP-dependent helicase/nuclease subunit B